MEPTRKYEIGFDPYDMSLSLDAFRDQCRNRLLAPDQASSYREIHPEPPGPSPHALVYCHECGKLVELGRAPRSPQVGPFSDFVPADADALDTCPADHEQLPGREANRDVHIALVGEKGASKSTYLAAIFDALRCRQAMRPYGFTAEMPRNWEESFRDTHHTGIFVHRIPMVATPLEDRDTLSADTKLGIRLAHRTNPELSVNLVFIDISGERLRGTAQSAPHLIRTGAAILFVEPESLSIPGHAWPDGTAKPLEMNHPIMLRRMLDSAGDRGAVTYPVCVALTKADLLAGIIDEHLLANGPQRRRSYYDLLFDSCLVQDLLEAWGARDYQEAAEESFETARGHQGVTYHVFAPTGSTPTSSNGGRLMYPIISPFRCLDPILSILIRKQFLPPYDSSGQAVQPGYERTLRLPLDENSGQHHRPRRPRR